MLPEAQEDRHTGASARVVGAEGATLPSPGTKSFLDDNDTKRVAIAGGNVGGWCSRKVFVPPPPPSYPPAPLSTPAHTTATNNTIIKRVNPALTPVSSLVLQVLSKSAWGP
jgi:hypothetical protein